MGEDYEMQSSVRVKDAEQMNWLGWSRTMPLACVWHSALPLPATALSFDSPNLSPWSNFPSVFESWNPQQNESSPYSRANTQCTDCKASVIPTSNLTFPNDPSYVTAPSIYISDPRLFHHLSLSSPWAFTSGPQSSISITTPYGLWWLSPCHSPAPELGHSDAPAFRLLITTLSLAQCVDWQITLQFP